MRGLRDKTQEDAEKVDKCKVHPEIDKARPAPLKTSPLFRRMRLGTITAEFSCQKIRDDRLE